MTSIVRMIDDSYLDYEALVETNWGKTKVRAMYEEDFITALAAILPRGEDVQIIKDILDPFKFADELRKRRYSVYIHKR